MGRQAKIIDTADDIGELITETVIPAPVSASPAPSLLRRALGFPKASAPMVTEVPSLEDVSSEYAALVRKSHTIANEIVGIEREIQEAEAQLGRFRSEAALLQQERVNAILDDTPEDPETVATKASLGKRLSELRPRASDLRAAQVELQRRIGAAKQRASIEVCNRIGPHYREVVRTMCERLRDLHQAQMAFHRLVDTLEREDVAWTRLVPMHPHFLGDPTDSQSRTALYFREALQSGFITRDEIPEELR